MDRDAAREALDSIGKARGEIADRARAPRGYYSFLGGGAGLLTLSMGSDAAWRWVLTLVGAVIVFRSIYWYRESTGVWAMGNLFARYAWRYWLMIVPFAGGLVATVVTASFTVGAVCGAAVFLWWSVLGPQWDRDYRRALQEDR